MFQFNIPYTLLRSAYAGKTKKKLGDCFAEEMCLVRKHDPRLPVQHLEQGMSDSASLY